MLAIIPKTKSRGPTTTAFDKKRKLAQLVSLRSKILHGRDQSDVRLTSSALGSSTGENRFAYDAAALWLRAET